MSRTKRPRLLPTASWLLGLAVLVACGGQPTPEPEPDPTGLREVDGQVRLPDGLSLDLSSFQVLTAHGSYPVATDGRFTAELLGTATTEVGLQGADGDLLLLGLSNEEGIEVSALATAQVLLHHLLGGFALPAEQQQSLWPLILNLPQAADLEEEVLRLLLDGQSPLTLEDPGLQAAMVLAWEALLADASQTGMVAFDLATHQTAGLPPQALAAPDNASNIVLQPGSGVQQAGSAMLHNPSGSGVVAQNHIRRPGALLAYQVAFEDSLGERHELEPPVLAQRVDVPSTEKLELFTAIVDVLTGSAPWTPVLSPGMALPLHGGQHRTHYELVLLGPSLDVVTRPPLYDDPRFSGARSEWNEIIGEKTLELFLNDLALPLLESFVFGRTGVFEVGKLRQLRENFKILNDKHLAKLGVFLRQGGSYAEALKFVLDELAHNGSFRLDFMDVVKEALTESERNKMDFDAVEARLRGRASAAAIAAAVQLALTAGDVGAILKDLNDALPAVSWQAVASPTLFYLSPEAAYFTKQQPSVELTVGTRGPVGGTYLYRWSTTGRHGRLSDGPTNGLSIDSPYPNVWYIHGSPHTITDEQTDGVSVEVYEVESVGAGIPPGAEPVARMAAELQGFDREIDGRLEVMYGVTADGYFRDGITASCATMYIRFPKESGAKRYDLRFEGWGAYQHPENWNTDLLYNPTFTYEVDPADTQGYVLPWKAVCDWFGPNGGDIWPYHFHTFDTGTHYLVGIFTAMGPLPGQDDSLPSIGHYVRLWYDWASQGTVNVTVIR